METLVSLALIEQAQDEMSSGHFREAGRLALEAAEAVVSSIEADAVATFAEESMERCGFMQRGRFEAALEHVQELRMHLAVPAA
jgi:hypothetical protein